MIDIKHAESASKDAKMKELEETVSKAQTEISDYIEKINKVEKQVDEQNGLLHTATQSKDGT